ncbi:MAG: DUF1801 domain-containing protein [Bacteroidota bacterium]|nr:DUF1801 domain-containing protein [Bacteroidota bacterium]MDP4229291.1 DUF1801 domain-containing protein [Bacteroidota bacterium]MDP4234884.1 DUF1801 domain-containing protein [Bacteroidota bacterium]
MTPKEYIDSLPEDRKEVISKLRLLILKSDPLVKEVVAGMMGREMLVYMQGDFMKYALSSVKDHMSFHSMVMYGSSIRFGGSGLREKFEKLLPKAKFQKGCINFKNALQMPLDIAEKFVKEMATVEYPPAEYKDRMEKSVARLKAKQGKAKPKAKAAKAK